MDKRKPHYSSLIVSGQMSRADAVRLLDEEPYDPAVAQEDLIYVKKKFGLNDAEFAEIMGSPPRSADEYPNTTRLLRALAPWVGWIKDLATARRRPG